jgi:hypothetical protein
MTIIKINFINEYKNNHLQLLQGRKQVLDFYVYRLVLGYLHFNK